MGINGSNEVTMSAGDEAEGSDTKVEIKIKTLDSQTYTLRVNKCVPVPALKEQIATVTGVLSDQQRLICRGKVLKDDQLLSAYHVEDGHTLHLVVRQPIPPSSSPSTGALGSDAVADHPASPSSSTPNLGHQVAHTFVFESVNIDQGEHSIPGLNRFISGILNSIATGSVGSGNGRSDRMETGSERLARASANTGSSDSAFPQPNSATSGFEFDPQQAAFRFPSSSSLGFQHPAEIPDSLTTINQYLRLMRDEFRREGFTANDREHRNNEEASGNFENVGRNHDVHSHSVPDNSGLPSPANLAAIVLSVRELLIELAGGCLYQLASQLEGQGSITDPLIRTNIQNSAIRFGVLLQNLGPLLLEIGRTTMTLRMGQTPSEAVVNAGPALFVSASGPNPMMIQPLPFHPGSSFGGVHVGSIVSTHGLQGNLSPVGTANFGEQAGAEQSQNQTDPAGNTAGPNFVHPVSSGASGSASFNADSGVRVVPIRRVVAVPGRVNRSPSDPSGNPVGFVIPVLARAQQLNPGNVNAERRSQGSTESHPGGREVDQQPIRDGHQLPTNSAPAVSGLNPSVNESTQYQGSARVFITSRQRPPASNNNDSTQAHDGQQNRQYSAPQRPRRFERWLRTVLMREEANVSGISRQDSDASSATHQAGTTVNAAMQGVATVSEDQGIFFSNLVRQLMPYIAQGTAGVPAGSSTSPSSSAAQAESENLTGSSSSQQRRDAPDAPNPKRPKKDR